MLRVICCCYHSYGPLLDTIKFTFDSYVSLPCRNVECQCNKLNSSTNDCQFCCWYMSVLDITDVVIDELYESFAEFLTKIELNRLIK